MRAIGNRSVLAIAAAALIFVPGAARSADDGAFQRELRAQNAAHLKAAIPLFRQPSTSMIDPGFSDPPPKGPWELRSGKLRITVTMTPENSNDPDMPRAPHLTLSLSGQTVFTSEGSEGFASFPSFLVQLVEMEGGNPYPEIVFSSYTGGAHCCSDTRIITSGKDGRKWREIEAGAFDGGPLAASDLDGDGRYELALRDNAFLYTFGCYACSAAPLQVLRLEGGRIVDVSGHKDFFESQRDSLAGMVQGNAGGFAESNGFLAGYVGQKIRLGEGAEAFEFARKYYDRKSDWGLERCSVKRDSRGDCPGKLLQLKFPDALKQFLEEAGYPLSN